MDSIVRVEKVGDDKIWVAFSDGTSAGYIVEELLELRILRDRAVSFLADPAVKIHWQARTASSKE